MTGERLDALDIPMMVTRNTTKLRTPMTVSVDLLQDTTTGVSAHDRARTIRALVDPQFGPDDFGRPGHVQPLRAQDGGVFARPGHTEAGVDLARLAGIPLAAALCEVTTDDKLDMARRQHLERLSAEHHIPLISIAALIAYRQATETITEIFEHDYI
jgi:3,4-dihydroxy-2-butanone 4-phosphate synthase